MLKAVESSKKKTWKVIPTDSLSQSDKESFVSDIEKIFTHLKYYK